jgi:RNA-directed DNA polymerase
MQMTAGINFSAGASFASQWEGIDWGVVYKEVKRLQVRIAKAIKQGRHNKAKALQRLLTCSFYAKLLAVKRVVSNTGGKTPGVDGKVWKSSSQKWTAALALRRHGYQTKPLRRVYIPKSNGKLRPLSIPVMQCRAMQALHLMALEPISESTADPNSYGFRPKRSTADAIDQCFKILCHRSSAQWILECDIQSCFDEISHEWLSKHIPMDKQILGKWLKAGYVDQGAIYKTEKGTPQGGIISPVLLVMTLKGLEKALLNVVNKRKGKQNIVVYADDFIVTGSSKEMLETKVKPVIESFLAERGLSLSAQKTLITHVNEGVDFLGFTVRKFETKLIIRPSKKGRTNFLSRIRELIKSFNGNSAYQLISTLNPKIRGWSNYYRHVCSKKTFNYVDSQIFKAIWKWAKRRHPDKNAQWVKDKYFTTIGARNWVFYGRKNIEGKPCTEYLESSSNTRIQRHIKIRAHANPYDPSDHQYFLDRSKRTRRNDSSELLRKTRYRTKVRV